MDNGLLMLTKLVICLGETDMCGHKVRVTLEGFKEPRNRFRRFPTLIKRTPMIGPGSGFIWQQGLRAPETRLTAHIARQRMLPAAPPAPPLGHDPAASSAHRRKDIHIFVGTCSRQRGVGG